jgi:hypothetical protein
MKNIQIVDTALNCTYDIFSASDEEFALIFPEEGQEIEFIEDYLRRMKKQKLLTRNSDGLENLWLRPVNKHNVEGIHGTLFYGRKDLKRIFQKKKWNLTHDQLLKILRNLSKHFPEGSHINVRPSKE